MKNIICLVLILLVVCGAVCIIDHHRMENNQPVLFSTWGKKYVPPLESFSAVMCSGKGFHNSKNGAYLEIIFDDEKHTKKKLAVKDSTYIILSNRNDITFEQAWKASGLSSNSEDYFNAEDAVIVGRK